MPISGSDLKQLLSGGGGNTNPNASLGGVRSTTEVVDNTVENLFDNITGSESSAGDVEYRCYYFKNAHGTITWEDVVAWLESQISGGASVQIGLDPAGVGNGTSTGVATTIANESTAPTGVTFSTPTDKPSGLSVGDVGPGEMFAIWVKRTVAASTPGQASDGYDLRVEGDTAPA